MDDLPEKNRYIIIFLSIRIKVNTHTHIHSQQWAVVEGRNFSSYLGFFKKMSRARLLVSLVCTMTKSPINELCIAEKSLPTDFRGFKLVKYLVGSYIH